MSKETDENIRYYNQKRLRKAEFVMPPNSLKAKVGSGGLSDSIIDKAQRLLENNTIDFQPLAEMYLSSLKSGINRGKEAGAKDDKEHIISAMLYPAMQLKANGAMFHYPLVTKIADRLVHFLEVIADLDIDAIEIVLAFHTTIRAVVMGRITGDGGTHGQDLFDALDEACMRYFERAPYNKKDREREEYDFPSHRA